MITVATNAATNAAMIAATTIVAMTTVHLRSVLRDGWERIQIVTYHNVRPVIRARIRTVCLHARKTAILRPAQHRAVARAPGAGILTTTRITTARIIRAQTTIARTIRAITQSRT